MEELLAYMTAGRWAMVWVVGWVIAYFSTAWKDGPDGLAGSFLYLLFSFAIFILWVLVEVWIGLWRFFG